MRFLFIIVFIGGFIVPSAVFAQRYALVIGNSNYAADIGYLKNPVNDAKDMASLLRSKEFKVISLANASKRQMKEGISKFTRKLSQEGAVGLFFYAGHGMEVSGRNYLIPVNAKIEGEGDVEYESIDAGRVMNGMKLAGNKLNIIILDACRNNPFARSFRSSSRGLRRVDPPEGSLMLYATAPGKVAADGDGRNGLFTRHLLKAMSQPNVSVEKVFKHTTNNVYRESAKKQRPWSSGSIVGEFYFSKTSKPAVSRIKTKPARYSQSAEVAFWSSIADETDALYFSSYLTQYPKGIYAQLAKLKIQRDTRIVKAEPKQQSHFTVKTTPSDAKIRILNIGPKYQDNIELKPGRYHLEVSKSGYQRHTEWLELSAEDKIHSVVLVETQKALVSPIQSVKEKTKQQAPIVFLRNQYESEMVDIQGGCYQIGSPSWEKGRDKDEKQHKVCVNNFQMGKKEVTVAEFKNFVRATGYRTEAEGNVEKQGCYSYSSSENKWAWRAGRYWNKVGFSQNDQYPVVCVSWNDAQRYIAWLNKNSTGKYRLPTEAEWEYAARGGRKTAYFWGDAADSKACRYANINDKNWGNEFPCDDGYEYTAPVGNYQPNAYGLYDISGNVWEWTCSKYDKAYRGGDDQCVSNNRANNSDVFALRGGSFVNSPQGLRLANRNWNSPRTRYDIGGFRLARTY